MSSKLPKHFLDEMLRRNLDRMNMDPEQTIPDDFFIDTWDEEETATEGNSTLKFFK